MLPPNPPPTWVRRAHWILAVVGESLVGLAWLTARPGADAAERTAYAAEACFFLLAGYVLCRAIDRLTATPEGTGGSGS